MSGCISCLTTGDQLTEDRERELQPGKKTFVFCHPDHVKTAPIATGFRYLILEGFFYHFPQLVHHVVENLVAQFHALLRRHGGEDGAEGLFAWHQGFQLIGDAAEKRRIHQVVGREVGGEYHQLVKRQREIGQELGSFVSEGRDQGSVVFPNADVRFVLEASLSRRAARRHQELMADGEDVRIEDVVENLKARDSVDVKQWVPLLASDDSVVIDTTEMSISQVIERMHAVVADRTA